MTAPLKVSGGVGMSDVANPVYQTVTLATIGGYLFESAADALTATAGGGQTNALQLTSEISRVATVATAGDSVKLPPSVTGLTVYVINHGAASMQVYGLGTDTIDDVAYATGVAQMAGSMVLYACTTAGAWYSNGIGTGYAGQYATQSYVNGLTANATQTQAGGLAAGSAITASIARVTTVATAGNANTLPLSAPGMQITVTNAAASNALNLFPNVGDQINVGGANTALSLAAGKTIALTCAVAGQWHGVLSA